MTALCFPFLALTVFLFIKHNKKVDRKIAAGEEINDQTDFKFVY
jgi:hypothetical protein